LTLESVETQLWATKAVRQRIPSRRTRNSKTLTTETIQSIAEVWSTCAEWQTADDEMHVTLISIY